MFSVCSNNNNMFCISNCAIKHVCLFHSNEYTEQSHNFNDGANSKLCWLRDSLLANFILFLMPGKASNPTQNLTLNLSSIDFDHNHTL